MGERSRSFKIIETGGNTIKSQEQVSNPTGTAGCEAVDCVDLNFAFDLEEKQKTAKVFKLSIFLGCFVFALISKAKVKMVMTPNLRGFILLCKK